MLVKIEEIQAPGLQRTEPVAKPVLQAALTDGGDFQLVSSTPLEASFNKVSGHVMVTGRLSLVVTAPCKRCVNDVELTLPVAFSVRMIREAPPVEEEDDDAPSVEPPRKRKHAGHRKEDAAEETMASFELDEIDAEPFDGKVIDLDPVVREHVVLALPVSVLCKEDCKGLCSTCGIDLNEKDCGHGAQKQADPRFAKLKDITLKN